MSASTRTVQGQIGYGGFKSAFVALALVVLMAAAVAIVALGASRTAPATESLVPVPVIITEGRGDTRFPAAPYVPSDEGLMDASGNSIVKNAQGNTQSFGGWGGPRLHGPTDGVLSGPAPRAQ